MRYKIFLLCIAFCVLAIVLMPHFGQFNKKDTSSQKEILCSTFAMSLITRNVVKDCNLSVHLMLPANMGCPHDYMMTPQDMLQITNADVLVINGLGMENFLTLECIQGKTIIDSSKGIKDILYYVDHENLHNHHEHHEHHEHHSQECTHEHEHHGINPHMFASPHMVGQLAMNIANGLAEKYPQFKEKLLANAIEYKEKMDSLHREFCNSIKNIPNRRIIAQHGSLDYLARDINLEIVAFLQESKGDTISAANMIKIVHLIKEKNVAVICTEPQYSPALVETIASEAKISTVSVDPVATGIDNAPLDYYIKIMKQNIKNLSSVLNQ